MSLKETGLQPPTGQKSTILECASDRWWLAPLPVQNIIRFNVTSSPGLKMRKPLVLDETTAKSRGFQR
ncbi:MAG: hypothetical protein IPN95_19470 [Bacteroidetes bacterium]|nr:hypothetical protein [Bacteroidota bacterium]